MSISLWLAAGGILIVLLITGLRSLFRRMRRDLEKEMRRRFSDHDLLACDPWVNFVGLKSRGVAQIRGNGILALTRYTLWFLMAVPRKEIRINLNEITGVSLTRSHCGKARLARMLKVEIRTLKGTDAGAWLVKQPEQWVELIEQARAGR